MMPLFIFRQRCWKKPRFQNKHRRMKKIFLFLLVAFAFSACEKNSNDLEAKLGDPLRLDGRHICFNFELDYRHEMPEAWQSDVVVYLKSENFNVANSELGFEEQPPLEQPVCGNCLFTGHYLHVVVPVDQRDALKDLGFREP